MKIDCSNILNFKTEHMRMCESYTSCYDCPFENKFTFCSPSDLGLGDITQEVIDLVQKWSDEHQQKTILEDVLEKLPNIPREKDGTPDDLCPDYLGYEKSDEFCGKENGCQICWNRVIEAEVW